MLALHGADHEIGFAERLGVAVADRDIEAARDLAERGAARILVERGVDGDDAARGVVARLRRAPPATLGRETAGNGRSGLAKTKQRDHARRK